LGGKTYSVIAEEKCYKANGDYSVNYEDYARDSLSVTSQFYYCGLPLRLDSYSRCQFNCSYCFANARGGNRGSRKLRIAKVMSIRKRLERIQDGIPRSVIDELLLHRQPIHFGGMSDPFMPVEVDASISLHLLEILAEFNYPTVVSTKSDLCTRDDYLEVLKKGSFIIQASISTMDEKLLDQIDLGTPGPKAMIRALTILQAEGIPATCRIQPLLPGRESDAYAVIDACANAGVKHVAVEHLKLPIEKSWPGTRRLSAVINVDLRADFITSGARQVGRELILPPEQRFERILDLRCYSHKLGLTFGAADNDFLLLSDGTCCCSGIDLINNDFASSFGYNYIEAIRRGVDDNTISIGSIDDVWCPKRSIGQYMNSHSRIKAGESGGAGIGEYIRRNWNGSVTGNSPNAFYGVLDTGEQDSEGYQLYTLTDEMRSLLRDDS
jgi:DNA repair photolyase